MTVIIYKKIKVLDEETEIKTFYPSGGISEDQIKQAEDLDSYLKKEIDNRIRIIEKKSKLTEYNLDLYKWYLLGKWLNKLINVQKLVKPTDVENGFLWKAIWQYIPNSFSNLDDNKNIVTDKNSAKKNRDYLYLSNELSKFEWKNIRWMKEWWYWLQINHRPTIIRDKRIFLCLGKILDNKRINSLLNRKKFIQILKSLSEKFKSGKDSKILKDNDIEEFLEQIVNQHIN